MSQIAIGKGGAIVYAPGTSDKEIEEAAVRAAIRHGRLVLLWRLRAPTRLRSTITSM